MLIKSLILVIVGIALWFSQQAVAQPPSNPNHYDCRDCDPAMPFTNACLDIDINSGVVGKPPCIMTLCYGVRQCNGRTDVQILSMSVPACADLEFAGDQYSSIVWGLIWRNSNPLGVLPTSTSDTINVRIYSSSCWRYAQCTSPPTKLLMPCSPPCCITTIKKVRKNSCGGYDSWQVECTYEGVQSVPDYCEDSYSPTGSGIAGGQAGAAPCNGSIINIPGKSGCVWTCFNPGGKTKKTILRNGVFEEVGE